MGDNRLVAFYYVFLCRCPDNECKESLPPAIVRDVLGDESYDRWEKLLLQVNLLPCLVAIVSLLN